MNRCSLSVWSPAAALLLCLSSVARADFVIGRSPRPDYDHIQAGPFVQADIDDVLAVEFIGRLLPATRPGTGRIQPRLFRLGVLRLLDGSVREVWRSRPLLADPLPGAKLGANAWTVTDLTGDGRLELLIFAGDLCQVVSFGPDSITTRELPMPGSWVADAVAAELDEEDGVVLVTLESAPTDSLLDTRLLRVYAITDSGFEPLSDYLTGLFWHPGTDVRFLGSARIEGYPGRLPVVAGIRREPGPSALAVLYRDDSDQYRLTTRPFPLREWFAKDEVLPGGRLTLADENDSLVAYGYFVPGSRLGGPAVSFATLSDGAWRLLPVADAARAIGWPACPYRHQN
ncbi:MAG TPA: hypothetical protein ENN51_06695, partial [candidate division WOR-3 bacterium]|nr:hypothetical protein [candidate division WOR-3 bacterium]